MACRESLLSTAAAPALAVAPPPLLATLLVLLLPLMGGAGVVFAADAAATASTAAAPGSAASCFVSARNDAMCVRINGFLSSCATVGRLFGSFSSIETTSVSRSSEYCAGRRATWRGETNSRNGGHHVSQAKRRIDGWEGAARQSEPCPG